MTLPQPPILIAAKHESNREPVGSGLGWRFECRCAHQKPSQPSAQKQKAQAGRPVQSVTPADDNVEVRHAPRLQTLSAKGLPLRVPR